jgi:hypothetical protein
MALRDRRGAGLRRAASGRAGIVALAVALYLGAGAFALAPDIRKGDSEFLGYGKPRPSSVTPGDHLQSTYNLWLPGHQLEEGRAPWKDPYSFQPEASERTNFAGWPFAIVFWPLHALLGTVTAWNAFLVLTYLGAGGLAALWLRALELPLGAALVGGLAFALAPYRSVQTAGGHLLAPIAMLLPLALYALERRRAWLAVAALASIPLSGQVHLALGAIPFVAIYGVVRSRTRSALIAAGIAAAVGVGVYLESIRRTTGAAGRSFAQVERYSAEPLDFVTRHARHGFESFVYLGWLVPLAAAAGAFLLVRRREHALSAVLAAGAIVPIVLALGANTPLYEPLWDVVPGLHHTRVPERFLPIACLCIAALAAFAVARVRVRGVALVALALVALDLRVDPYVPMGADEHNPVYAALRAQPDGRYVERPTYLPDRFEGSIYTYYAIQAQRERPSGYSTTAPPDAAALARELRDSRDSGLLERLGVRYAVLFEDGRPQRYVRLP